MFLHSNVQYSTVLLYNTLSRESWCSKACDFGALQFQCLSWRTSRALSRPPLMLHQPSLFKLLLVSISTANRDGIRVVYAHTNFCGTSWGDASSECEERQPCPQGTDEECTNGGKCCFLAHGIRGEIESLSLRLFCCLWMRNRGMHTYQLVMLVERDGVNNAMILRIARTVVGSTGNILYL